MVCLSTARVGGLAILVCRSAAWPSGFWPTVTTLTRFESLGDGRARPTGNLARENLQGGRSGRHVLDVKLSGYKA